MAHRLLHSVLIATLLVLIAAPAALASADARGAGGAPGKGGQPAAKGHKDNRLTAKDVRRQKLLKAGIEAKLSGKANGKTYQVARGQFVQLAREGEGAIWTVLGEFKDLKHNTIAKPDRTKDNTTIWTGDFSRSYYLNMLFNDSPGANSMRNYYIEQSSGRYAVNGDVTDWVTVPGNAASYDDAVGTQVWSFLADSVNGWYAQQEAAGKTDAQINAYLTQFDKTDRYDYDGDGNFNEPDGYIDTFQSVHAGEGEEAGAPWWTIWSHSWYAYSNLIGVAGPSFNQLGGLQIGNSDFWVGKYTIQPENGGVGVFAHEFGHDLGLPDLYDTQNGDNAVGFWSLMDSGSWLSDGTTDIGSKPSHMGAWEKLQLGWLNYEVATAGKSKDIKLGPMETNTKQAQAAFVVLPKKSVVTDIGAPYAGSKYYYSGTGDDQNNYMYRSFTLPTGAVGLAAKVNFSIELDWDYAYVVVSTDGGTTWTSVATNLSSTTNLNGQNFGYGITGSSGGAWVDLTADLSAYAGKTVMLGFRYWTDGAYSEIGFKADDIAVTGSSVDGAETNTGWTFKPTTGFRVTTGTESAQYSNYYVAEYRTYYGYDSVLKAGPYFFGYLNDPSKGNYVDRFPYQDGLLVSYWDNSQTDNDVSMHLGSGLVLPVDAHPTALVRNDGVIWRNRIQSYDSTFGLEPTDALNLHVNSLVSPIPSLAAVPVFDDRGSYYDPSNPTGSVVTPNTSTQIRVINTSAQGSFMQIQVRPAK